MSQFRRDPVSGEWIILAPERVRRPEDMHPKQKRITSDIKKCPFEKPETNGNWPPVLEYAEKGRWAAILVPNKYPALRHENACPAEYVEGPYIETEGVGYHELLITRDHYENFADISPALAYRVFKIFAERYRTIDEDKCMAYLSIFGNWGLTAGASQGHPHYQLMALPVIPPDVARSYNGSERYFKKHKRCIHCEILDFERQARVRIVGENASAIALAPFASRTPYEVRIFPKKHIPAFELTPDAALKDSAALMQKVLQKMHKKLNDPDYNFYIHTAPLNEKNYQHYHWHIEIAPRMTTEAGFEFATGIEINVVAPEAAAKLLK